MPMTVRELLDDPALDLRVVVDGALDRPIRWVHTTELADPTRYLQGGELILTTGVWRDAGLTSAQFVAPLRLMNVAALGYGIPTADGDVPADLVRACRRAGLPLIAVPFELPFIAVTRAFVDREYGGREDALRARVRRNDELVRAAGYGSGLESILDVLDTRLSAWVAGPGSQVAAAGPGPSDEDAAAVRAAVAGLQAEYPIAAGGWLAFPIVTVGRTEAHLVVSAGRRGLAEDDRAAVDQALPFLGLELARRRAIRESERRLASELVDLIMAGPGQQQAAAARLETFSLDAGRPLAAIVCEADDPDAGLDPVEVGLADAGVAAVAAVKAPEIVAVVQWAGGEPELADLAAALHERLGGADRGGRPRGRRDRSSHVDRRGPARVPVRPPPARRGLGHPPPGGLALAPARAPRRGCARGVPAGAAPAARGARRPSPVPARRHARPVPVVGLPLAADGRRAARPREHAPPPPGPRRAAHRARPGVDGGPRRPVDRAPLARLSARRGGIVARGIRHVVRGSGP